MVTQHVVFADLLATVREELVHLHKITKQKVIYSIAVNFGICVKQLNWSVNKTNLGVLKWKEKLNTMMQEQGFWLCFLCGDAYRMWLKVKMQEGNLC